MFGDQTSLLLLLLPFFSSGARQRIWGFPSGQVNANGGLSGLGSSINAGINSGVSHAGATAGAGINAGAGNLANAAAHFTGGFGFGRKKRDANRPRFWGFPSGQVSGNAGINFLGSGASAGINAGVSHLGATAGAGINAGVGNLVNAAGHLTGGFGFGRKKREANRPRFWGFPSGHVNGNTGFNVLGSSASAGINAGVSHLGATAGAGINAGVGSLG